MNLKWGLALSCCVVYVAIGMDRQAINPDHKKLILACTNGTCESIETLLQENENLPEKLTELDTDGKCPLDHARNNSNNVNGEIIDALYTYLSQDNKNFLLRRATSNGDLPLVKESVKNGALIEHECNISPFLLAAQDGYRDIIDFLYKKKPTLNEQFNYGLAVASQRGHTELEKWFRENGAESGHIDPDTGKTPAQLAIEGVNGKGHISTLRSLLSDLDTN